MKIESLNGGMNRRSFLQRAIFMSAGIASGAVLGEDEPPPLFDAALGKLNDVVTEFLDKYKVPGLSVVIAHRGELLLRMGFGWANEARRERVTENTLFRIASLTKPITSVAIFRLIDNGKLHLQQPVFGANGVLKFDYGMSYPNNVNTITIYHLLTHTCGGWANSGGIDPMFYEPSWSQQKLIEWTLQTQLLKHEPGTHYDYSNFGYCVLGRVIEKVTGRRYADFVQEQILKPCGIHDMVIGGNTLAERKALEPVYVGQASGGNDPYNMNIARMDSHGGWLATPWDMLRFVGHVNNTFAPQLLQDTSVRVMTKPSTANPHYACGWGMYGRRWCHDGSLPGTLTALVVDPQDIGWAAFINTRASGIYLEPLVNKMKRVLGFTER